MVFGQTIVQPRDDVGDLLRELRDVADPAAASAYIVRWSLPGARPMPRSIRPGNSVSSTRKFSATLSAL